MNTRTMVFIDGSNLYHSMKNNCGQTNLDFKAFVEKIGKECEVIRTYYYNIQTEAEKQKKFIYALTEST